MNNRLILNTFFVVGRGNTRYDQISRLKTEKMERLFMRQTSSKSAILVVTNLAVQSQQNDYCTVAYTNIRPNVLSQTCALLDRCSNNLGCTTSIFNDNKIKSNRAFNQKQGEKKEK